VQSYSKIPDLNLNLFMIVGDDRRDFLDTLVESFLFKINIWPNINSVNGQILERENMAAFKNLSLENLREINIKTMPISAFSASFVRKLVKNGLKDQFDNVYNKYLRQDQIDHLYNLISRGLKKPDPKATSSSSVVNLPKYRYPIERGTENFDRFYHAYEAEQLEKARLKAIIDAEKAEKAEAKRIKDAEKAEKAAADVENRPPAPKRKKGGSRKTKRRRLTKRRKSRKHRKSKRRHY
jgi:hypothetical protein